MSVGFLFFIPLTICFRYSLFSAYFLCNTPYPQMASRLLPHPTQTERSVTETSDKLLEIHLFGYLEPYGSTESSMRIDCWKYKKTMTFGRDSSVCDITLPNQFISWC